MLISLSSREGVWLDLPSSWVQNASNFPYSRSSIRTRRRSVIGLPANASSMPRTHNFGIWQCQTGRTWMVGHRAVEEALAGKANHRSGDASLWLLREVWKVLRRFAPMADGRSSQLLHASLDNQHALAEGVAVAHSAGSEKVDRRRLLQATEQITERYQRRISPLPASQN